MSKPKTNTKSRDVEIARETREKFDRKHHELEMRVAALEQLLARLENTLKGPERPSLLISDEELQDIHSKLQSITKAVELFAKGSELNSAGLADLGKRVDAIESEPLEGIETRVAVLEAGDSPEIFARLEKLEKDFAEIVKAGTLSAAGGVMNARGSIDLAARVDTLEKTVATLNTRSLDGVVVPERDFDVNDTAEANAATREALRTEIRELARDIVRDELAERGRRTSRRQAVQQAPK